jgi:hypothetical protein
VAYAADLYENADHRPVVDAFFLARTAMDEISRVLSIPPAVLEVYRYLFMDMSVFRNKLEVISYARDYEGSPYGKELVHTAVSVGPTYLRWAYGDGGGELDTRFVIRKTMIDAYFRGLAHKGNALSSNTAKEALKWWSTAIRNAESLEKIDPHTTKEAVDELRMALEAKDDTLKPEQAPVPISDILH